MTTRHIQATPAYVRQALYQDEREGRDQGRVMRGDEYVSYGEAYAYLAKAEQDGLEVFPCECDGVDEKTGRCPGWQRD